MQCDQKTKGRFGEKFDIGTVCRRSLYLTANYMPISISCPLVPGSNVGYIGENG
jgi:hypothetical protein